MSTLKTSDVLKYSQTKRSSGTVRRHYMRWREENGLPERCDNEQCRYFTEALVWNGKLLPLILDHVDGNNTDNRPKMLRLLCPNCDSQNKTTRGGANKGRVQRATGGFSIKDRETGKKAYVLPAGPGSLVVSGGALRATGRKVRKPK